MNALYFAYGSNLKAARLRARVPSARPAGAARLRGYRLVLDKRGADGSAKANLAPAPGEAVWGALYHVEAAELPLLDRAEGGYARVRIQAESADGRRVEAWTYLSERCTEDRRAVPWYRRLILQGAEEHGLSQDWRALLQALPVRPEE